ncbi:uncharacterized protein VTP21DRAFT_4012 [Calcarisporiella thermophila]|uniref:uncharacterized protein n=1 Tax=Calcarisporiella thermophila TaxID=911321 RepID=UPI003743C7FB
MLSRRIALLLFTLVPVSLSSCSNIKRSCILPYDGQTFPCDAFDLRQLRRRATGTTLQNASPSAVESRERVQMQLVCTEGDPRCPKIQRHMEIAARMLENLIEFQAPVTVRVDMTSFCEGNCNRSKYTTSQSNPSEAEMESEDGSEKSNSERETKKTRKPKRQVKSREDFPSSISSPGILVPSYDDDGQLRLFPRALLKQKMAAGKEDRSGNATSSMKEMDEVPDIIIRFNSDYKFRFLGEKKKKGKVDLMSSIFRGLVIGLGQFSAWSDNLLPNTLLTPTLELNTQASGRSIIVGMSESVFDKFLITLPERRPMSELASGFSRDFAPSRIYSESEMGDYAKDLNSTSQGQVARDLMRRATTKGAIGFQVPGSGDVYILETGLNPFMRGASMSLLDKTSAPEPDQVATFSDEFGGITFEERVQTYGGSPLGGQERDILVALGYRTMDIDTQKLKEIMARGSTNPR